MATVKALGASGSGNFSCAANAVTTSTIFTTPSAGGSPDGTDYNFFVTLALTFDSELEIALTTVGGRTVDTTQVGGVFRVAVGPNTAIVVQARNRKKSALSVYWTYHYLGDQIRP